MADAFNFGEEMSGSQQFSPELDSDSNDKDEGPKITEVIDDLD